MNKHSIRLGSTITLDEEYEADLINKVEKLSSSHRLGEVVSYLIRIAFESPEKLESKQKLDEAIKEISSYGMSLSRKKFFEQVTSEINNMKNKVDKMYEMNLKLLTMAQMGKRLGLKEKANNMLSAQFLIEKQIEALCSTLGVAEISTFESNKLIETQKKADEIMEFIIESYDGILNEITEQLSSNHCINNSDTEVNKAEKIEESNETKVDNIEYSQNNAFSTDTDDEDDKVVDFGNADISALNNFFGV